MRTITIASSSISARAFHAPFQRQLRAGAIALILAGIAGALVPLGTSGTITDPAYNAAFATGANTLRWRLAMVSGLVYQTLLVLGSLALYVHLARTHARRWAFAGLVVTVGLTMLFVPMMGVAAFVVPAVGALIEQGHADAVAVMDQTFREPFAVLPFFAGIFVNLGFMLTGVAVWRAGTLWTWSGLLLIASGMLGVPAFLDVPQAQLVAPLVGGAALMSVGLSLWKRAVDDADKSRPGDRQLEPALEACLHGIL